MTSAVLPDHFCSPEPERITLIHITGISCHVADCTQKPPNLPPWLRSWWNSSSPSTGLVRRQHLPHHSQHTVPGDKQHMLSNPTEFSELPSRSRAVLEPALLVVSIWPHSLALPARCALGIKASLGSPYPSVSKSSCSSANLLLERRAEEGQDLDLLPLANSCQIITHRSFFQDVFNNI